MPPSRYALVTKCAGLPRVSLADRFPGLAEPEEPRGAGNFACTGAHTERTIGVHGATDWERRAKAEWLQNRTKRHGAPVWQEDYSFCAKHEVDPAFLCLSSVCSMINATQVGAHANSEIDILAFVDQQTPRAVFDGYQRLGVRVIDLSSFPFPDYFNLNPPRSPYMQPALKGLNRSTSSSSGGSSSAIRAPAVLQIPLSAAYKLAYPSEGPRVRGLHKGATVREAFELGYPHYSMTPDSCVIRHDRVESTAAMASLQQLP